MTRHTRRMPTMNAICAHHHLPHGKCLRCRQPARCEKAHIIEREYGGLDTVANIVPLCYPCHAEQPAFRPGEEARAWAWFTSSNQLDYLILLTTRCITEAPPELRARMAHPATMDDAVREARLLLGFDAPHTEHVKEPRPAEAERGA